MGDDMKNYSLWALALILGAAAAGPLRSGLLHSKDANGQQITTTNPQIGNAAARDGAYLGKVAALGGEAPHAAIGRWATKTDRLLFLTSYKQAYDQNLAGNEIISADKGIAAFRDGIYLGKLDTEAGNDRHLAVGRWAKDSDRLAFAAGYNRSFNSGELAHSEPQTIMRQALLVH
jgi:hypothetical protein